MISRIRRFCSLLILVFAVFLVMFVSSSCRTPSHDHPFSSNPIIARAFERIFPFDDVDSLRSLGVNQAFDERENSFGMNFLMLAMWNRATNCVDFLLATSDVHELSRNGESALFYCGALREQAIPVGRRLLERGLDVNHLDHSGGNAVLASLQLQEGANGDYIKWLVENGARPDIVCQGVPLLSVASSFGTGTILECLIPFCLWQVNKADSVGATPIFYVVASCHIPTKQKVNNICTLVNAGANVNHANIEGVTPLHLAVSKNELDLVSSLLSQGADPNLHDASGKTAIDMASANGSEKIKELLEEYESILRPPRKQAVLPE